jgi:tRNA-dihydrouridine synthase
VHGRTVEQKYVGPSRWEFLKEVKRHVGDKVILGSGDLFSASACVSMIRETGVDGVTIARGAIGNPWIFEQCVALWNALPLPPPPTVHEQRDVLRRHAQLLEETYGPDRWLGQMRKFSFKYAALHPTGAEVRNAFALPKTPAEWATIVEQFYANDAPGVDPSAPSENESCE